MKNVLVLHGPNLNLLGTREPDIYGSTTLPELESQIADWASELGVQCRFFQSNHEGALIDALHDARNTVDGVLINGGALTHYSYALYDALVAIDTVVVEVHISNIHAREPWRRNSVTGPAADHVIYGRGIRGYRDGLRRLAAAASWPGEKLAYGDDGSQFGELRVPSGSGSHPVAVLVHGGFWHDVWTLDLMDSLAIDLANNGWATWNIEYRRVGSGGGWPQTADDVGAALDYLAKLDVGNQLDLENVTVIGHSAGGQLALWSASRENASVSPQRVVALAPVTDMVDGYERDLDGGAIAEFLGGSPADFPERYAASSPREMLPLGCRLLVVHGAADDRVPADASHAYVASALAAGDDVTLHSNADTDHFVVIDADSPEWAQARQWLGA